MPDTEPRPLTPEYLEGRVEERVVSLIGLFERLQAQVEALVVGQQEIRQEMREARQEFQQEMRDTRRELRDEIRDNRQEIRDSRAGQRQLIIATWTVGGGIIIALAGVIVTLLQRGGG